MALNQSGLKQIPQILLVKPNWAPYLRWNILYNENEFWHINESKLSVQRFRIVFKVLSPYYMSNKINFMYLVVIIFRILRQKLLKLDIEQIYMKFKALGTQSYQHWDIKELSRKITIGRHCRQKYNLTMIIKHNMEIFITK